MKIYEDELDPEEWIKYVHSKSESLSRSFTKEERSAYLREVMQAYGEIPEGAKYTATWRKTISDWVNSNIGHQKTFLRGILNESELEIWNGIFTAITPQNTFNAYASETPRGDQSILVSDRVVFSSANFSDFLVWRTSQHGKRLHEFNNDQMEIMYEFIFHVCGAILGYGTLSSRDKLPLLYPNNPGTILAKGVSMTSILYFIIAHEFAHFYLNHINRKNPRRWWH